MKKSSIVIKAALKVYPKTQSEFSSKDYYIRATVAIDGDGDKRGDGRTSDVNLFFDNANHKELFNRIDKAMTTQYGDEWANNAVEYSAVRGADVFDFDKPIYYYGYMVNYKLPEGTTIVRNNTKDGQDSVSGSIAFTLIGEKPTISESGVVIDEGWGETPYDAWMRFKKAVKRGDIANTRILEVNAGPADGDDSFDDDEPEVDEKPANNNQNNGQGRNQNNGGRRQ